MEIKEYRDDFFDNAKKIQIYNSYEPYYLYEMRKYYEENNIECIEASDTDLDVYLKYFNNIKYLYLNSQAIHLEEVNKLPNLNGISLCNNQIKEIDEKILEKLEYLEIYYFDKKQVDLSKFKSLKHLRLLNYPFENLEIHNELKSLEIDEAPRLTRLKGVNSIFLENLKLENIENLSTIELDCTELKSFYIYDSKKVTNLESFLSTCKKLKSIVIISYSDSKAVLKNINFINELENLEYFRTSFKILDGNLNPLLKIKDAVICNFYKNYNLEDKDLPHIYVSIDIDGKVKKVKLESLELGKDDPRIIWLK